MHHQEISKIVQIMGDLSFVTEGAAKVTIEHRVRSLNGQFKRNGLWLVVEWAKSRLVVEVSENEKDSDNACFYFHSNIELVEPDAAFRVTDKDFNVETFRLLTRIAMQASQGQIEVSHLKNQDFFRDTGIMTIDLATHIPKPNPHSLNCHDLL